MHETQSIDTWTSAETVHSVLRQCNEEGHIIFGLLNQESTFSSDLTRFKHCLNLVQVLNNAAQVEKKEEGGEEDHTREPEDHSRNRLGASKVRLSALL